MSAHESLRESLRRGAWGPFEWYTAYFLGPYRKVQFKRLNAYGPPPHGLKIAVHKFNLVVWFPRNRWVWWGE